MKMQPREEASGKDTKPSVQVVVSQKGSETPYAGVAQIILERVQNGEQFDDFCVLSRKNSDLREIAKYFESKGIPTHIHSGGRYLNAAKF